VFLPKSTNEQNTQYGDHYTSYICNFLVKLRKNHSLSVFSVSLVTLPTLLTVLIINRLFSLLQERHNIMKKKTALLGAAALIVGVVSLSPSLVSAYQGDPNVQGPNYTA